MFDKSFVIQNKVVYLLYQLTIKNQNNDKSNSHFRFHF